MAQARLPIPNRDPKKRHYGASLLSIPKDILSLIALSLSLKDLTALSLACSNYYNFFTPTRDFRKALLSAIMSANIEKAREYLQNPLVIPTILAQIPGKEFNGRKWQSVSPFEFAAWAGDQALIVLLLQSIPSTQKAEALRQLEKLVTVGIEHGYVLKPFRDLSGHYHSFNLYYNPDVRLEAEGFCIKAIGGAQAKLPSYSLQIFCDSERFTSESNKSDIFYLEALSELKNFGVNRFINKSNGMIFTSNRPIYGEFATYCENLIDVFCDDHLIFLNRLIEQLRLELTPVTIETQAAKRTRRK